MLPSCGFVLLYLVTRSEAATLVTDAVVRSQISAWAVFSVIYFVISALSIYYVKKAKGFRTPYALLVPSSFLLLLYTTFNCTLTIIYNLDDLLSDGTYIALETIQWLSGYLASALLFLALVLITKRRYDDLVHSSKIQDEMAHGPQMKLTFGFAYSVFFAITATGATAGALWSWFVQSRETSVSVEDSVRRWDVNYYFAIVANLVYVLAGAVLVVQNLYLRRKAEGVEDDVFKVLTMVLPLNYLAAVFLSLIFTVIQFTWELEVDDGTLLIFCLLVNFFSAIVVGLLVVFVLRIDVSRDAQEGNNTFEMSAPIP